MIDFDLIDKQFKKQASIIDWALFLWCSLLFVECPLLIADQSFYVYFKYPNLALFIALCTFGIARLIQKKHFLVKIYISWIVIAAILMYLYHCIGTFIPATSIIK